MLILSFAIWHLGGLLDGVHRRRVNQALACLRVTTSTSRRD